jgi:hypothetical protein
MGATHFLMKTLPRVASDHGATRAGLQSDPGHEHHGHSAAHGRDGGLAKPKKRLLNATRPKLSCFDTSGKAFRGGLCSDREWQHGADARHRQPSVSCILTEAGLLAG